ncbi:uncharacterized protein si:ch1073-220m6.1 [Cebidichthys violaceus]|uniref:uncharacterized protein si:ch1073-220m6.1 n=1 Tax=Cebidichthys violaceus TaxID=271503 RepID=UPI0035C9D784
MLLLLSCLMIAGITAKDTQTTHYRLKNGSMCLQVEESPPYLQDTWLFNKEAIFLGKDITPKYKDKVKYDPSNHSLCINNLTETDSGIYTFSFFNSDFKDLKETHKLIVEETVPRPVMRMSALHSNLSAGLCNITVNCSIRDGWVWSVCDGEGCRTSQRSLRKVNITIFTDNRSIVCSGNNHVSTSNVYENTEAMCLRKPNPEHEETSEPPTVIVIVTVIAVFVSLSAFAVCVVKGLFSTKYNRHQVETPAARITQSQQVEAKPQSVSSVSASSSSQAEACYENVDATQPCQTSSPTISLREELGSKQSQEVNTVYSVLPAVTSSLGKSDGGIDTERHKTTQETSSSKYVPLDEEEDIDTLYSVLQMPKKPQHHQ